MTRPTFRIEEEKEKARDNSNDKECSNRAPASILEGPRILPNCLVPSGITKDDSLRIRILEFGILQIAPLLLR